MSDNNTEVTHLPDQNRFIIKFSGESAVLEYEMGQDKTMMIMHTEVPPAQEGKGHASRLARSAMAYAQEQDLQVMPYCTYMATFLKRNKAEYKEQVSPEFSLD